MNHQENNDAPRHTNRLIYESSPYLLQHAYNPVDWYSWSEEALAKAKVENKPILLSIGYSACHWCHVQMHESFENEETARLLNEHFVSIKVDREERPDLDQIYMNAVQMMTGHGGWPLTIFLTPDLIPFFGGTYFPPEDRYHMPGFPKVLQGVAAAYRERPDEVRETAASILSELQRTNAASASSESVSLELLDAAFQGIRRNYDSRHGGFGQAPKFPAAMNLEFALQAWHRTQQAEALQIVTHTCRRMAEGGMYDQLGGGFHRYSTDAKWLVPHFEKMLYDNALLSRLYLHVYQATGDPFFRRITQETLDYVVREMTDSRGGFYSTQDADSEGEEGRFFVWSVDEVRELLDEADARLFSAYYDITPSGNFEGENILHVSRSAEETARTVGVSVEELMNAVERGRQVLFDRRERRVKPGRDEKVLTAWNGLMLASFAESSVVLERADYREAAERNAQFVLDNLRAKNLLLHSYKDGQAKLNAYLDDYAFMAYGLLTLYEATGTLRWLEEAVQLAARMIEEFWDEAEGGFFYTGQSHERLIVRTKDYFDNATPSGNSVAADLFLRLAVFTGNEDYQRKAGAIFRLMRDSIARYPSAFGRLLCALDFHLTTPREIAIVRAREGTGERELLREVWRRYLPSKVVAQAIEGDERAMKLAPLLSGRSALNGRATAYVCEHYTCKQPVTTPTELAAQLDS